MAKPLRHITGVKSSKIETMNLKDLDQWNSPASDDFIAKHKIEKHADRVGNGDDVYKGKTKEAAYKRQSPSVYEDVESLDETSKEKAEKYAHASAKDRKKHKETLRTSSYTDPKGDTAFRKYQNRTKGIDRAFDRIVKEDTESLDEKAYSFKAARAGKDIGEPGKKFKDIASKAAKRYGSEERGKKVAGAVLANIRAKHGIKEAACNHSSEGVHCEQHGDKACPDHDDHKKGKKLLLDKKKVNEAILHEVSPPSKEAEAWIKANKQRFVKEYGKKKGMEVLYATAWKKHGQSESGSATNTDYVGPGAAGWTTGRLDVGTL